MTVFPGAEPPAPSGWTSQAQSTNLAPQPPPADRGSTMTLFPKGVPSAYYGNRQKEQQQHAGASKPVNSDLGWLNLGLNNNSQTRL